MDSNFEVRRRKRPNKAMDTILNVLTLIVMVTILCVVAGFTMFFINPYNEYNPYPPPTLPAALGTPTATSTPAQPLPQRWTPTPTFTPPPTYTPTPTDTPLPTATPTATEPSPPFALQPGNPVRIPNIANGAGCDWMGVGGQAFSLQNEPIKNLGVHLEGELNGQFISLDSLTGSAPEIGPSGYVFNLTDKPAVSIETLWVQLNDGAGNSLSDVVRFTTSDSCDENFVMINWRQVREQ
jgi:hypothetical protein